MNISKDLLKSCVLCALETFDDIKSEKGVVFSSEDIVKTSISLYIQHSRNGDNGKSRTNFPMKLTLSFGKYRGRSLEEVLQLDRSYLGWLGQNSVVGKIKTAARELLKNNPITRRITVPVPKSK